MKLIHRQGEVVACPRRRRIMDPRVPPCSDSGPAIFPPAMSRGGPRTFKRNPFSTQPRAYSPDDIKARLLEAEAREAADTRSELERMFGDPSPERSALSRLKQRGVTSLAGLRPAVRRTRNTLPKE